MLTKVVYCLNDGLAAQKNIISTSNARIATALCVPIAFTTGFCFNDNFVSFIFVFSPNLLVWQHA